MNVCTQMAKEGTLLQKETPGKTTSLVTKTEYTPTTMSRNTESCGFRNLIPIRTTNLHEGCKVSIGLHLGPTLEEARHAGAEGGSQQTSSRLPGEACLLRGASCG